MTEPSRTADESLGTQVGASGELDPTLARPAGAPAGGAAEPMFGPPEKPGEVGRIGRYRVLKKLGQGGMGAVYGGLDGTLGRKVALKVLLPAHAADPESRARFVREARAAAAIQSDHVVTIFDTGEERGTAFIAMEYLLGTPLDQYLRTHGELPLAQVYRIGREIAMGLHAAHELGLVHRDIKPGNVWLEAPRGRVKILDFGLARAQNDDTQLTTSGLVVGTPAFMSPEQARGQKLDGRSDLFSLGIVLYRLATGQMPFDGSTTMAILTSLAVDEPTPVRRLRPDLPRPLADIIHKLLAKRPDGRFPTAWDVAEALAAAEELPPGEGESSVIDGAAPMAVPVQASGNVWAGLEDSRERPTADGTERIVRAPTAATTRPRAAGGRGRLVPLLVAAAVGINLLALAVVVVARLARPADGTLVIESEDPDAELRLTRDGEVVRDRVRDREVSLPPGSYTATVVGGRPGSQTVPGAFEVTARGHASVRVLVARPGSGTVLNVSGSVDRVAAEWVLSVGGAVRVNGSGGDVRRRAGLPPDPLVLTWVDLTGRAAVTDAGLGGLRTCRALDGLLLGGTAVTDAGLAHFAGLTALTTLDLNDTAVTDRGLAHFKGCRALSVLRLHRTAVTAAGLTPFDGTAAVTELVLSETRLNDAALVPFRNCKGLTKLVVYKTGVGDPGLALFAGITELTVLDVGDTPATDAGLAGFRDCKKLTLLGLPDAATDTGAGYFKGCPELKVLRVGGSKVTDAGLAHFASCSLLETLRVENTAITDTGLQQLTACGPSLKALDARGAKVTEEGLRAFAAAHPLCRITWDGATIEPLKKK